MNALLVRVGADLSQGGGSWNGPVDNATGDFAYIPIPETYPVHPGFAKPYSLVTPALARFGWTLPTHLAGQNMHLDPDFACLTYGDQGQRAIQISSPLKQDDLLVFYAALRAVTSEPRLIYAIIGLYVIERIEKASSIPQNRWPESAHTRRVLTSSADDIVVTARTRVSGRLQRCIPIGSFRTSDGELEKRPCYRVDATILEKWGGLSISDGFLQRSARLPRFLEPTRFRQWFTKQKTTLLQQNN
jgi:hypothetical protein